MEQGQPNEKNRAETSNENNMIFHFKHCLIDKLPNRVKDTNI